MWKGCKNATVKSCKLVNFNLPYSEKWLKKHNSNCIIIAIILLNLQNGVHNNNNYNNNNNYYYYYYMSLYACLKQQCMLTVKFSVLLTP